jgi:hypothetical protein
MVEINPIIDYQSKLVDEKKKNIIKKNLLLIP